MLVPLVPLVVLGCGRGEVAMRGVPLALDEEERLADHQPLSASTQSINRYHSVLSRFGAVDLRYAPAAPGGTGGGRLRVGFGEALAFENIDARFLVPLLAYPHGRTLAPFDRANLMLAEYSRNGIELAHQERNIDHGFFRDRGLFSDDEEYRFEDGKVVPSPAVRPKRMSLTNNCLHPRLWEIAAVDSVGEIFHAWMTLPAAGYLALVRSENGLDSSDAELAAALDYDKGLRVPLELDRLRTVVRRHPAVATTLDGDKPVQSYSTQDSRRKVQRKFYQVERAGQPISPARLGELQGGDRFRFVSFVPPGIYTRKALRDVDWPGAFPRAEVAEVTPRTRFPGSQPVPASLGAIELALWQDRGGGRRAIVVGNLPLDLLVFEEDFDVPGFGVGVLRASETIERRYAYFKAGPAPVYAYVADEVGGQLQLVNNHEVGLEQIYLRPRRGPDGQVLLAVTLVAYERIVDLVEIDVPLPGELAAKIEQASASYRRPLWRALSDSNVL